MIKKRQKMTSIDYQYTIWQLWCLYSLLIQVTDEDITYFKTILQDRVVTDPDELEFHNKDWLSIVK